MDITRARTKEEIIEAMEVRRLVFQVEQGIKGEVDFDEVDNDPETIHFIAKLGQKVVGTVRVRKTQDDAYKVERLAVLKEYRNKGVANHLLRLLIMQLNSLKANTIFLHAQTQVKKIFEEVGFVCEGDEFIHEGTNIPHVKMVLKE